MAIQWSVPVWMWPLLLVVAAGAVVYTVATYRRTRPDAGLRVRRALTALRSGALVLLVLAAAGPVTSCLRPRLQPAELVFVLEDSASMALTDDPADPTAPTRWQRALEVAGSVDSLFAARQPTVRRVFLRGNGLQPLQEFSPRDVSLPAPSRHGTSLSALAGRLRERLAGRPVRAVVLLSDGGETDRGGSEAAAANAVASLPLSVIGIGPDAGIPDRALADVRHPPVTYVGEDLLVAFAVAQVLPAGPPAPLVVTLSDAAGVVAADTLAADTPGADLAVVPGAISFRPRGEGLQALRLEVSPLVNERFLGNNVVTLAVDVRRDRARVLVLAGAPGWDVRFLALAAAAERRLDLDVAYPTPRGLVLADSLQTWRVPRSPAAWAAWDAVVLTGWSGTDAAVDWVSLAAAVEGGLGLLVLPAAVVGRDGQPVALAPPAVLADLLPVTFSPWRWEPGARFASMPEEGATHPVLDGVAGNRTGSQLASLPPWRAVAHAAARPGAITLLTAAAAGAGDGGGLPALVVADRGQGRVAWFGVRQVWEWAFWELPGSAAAGAEQPARRVLRNLLVWVAAGDGRSGLDFAAQPGVRQEGQPIRIEARWRDLRGEPVSDRLPALEVRPSGPGTDTTMVRTFAMAAVAGEPGVSEVELSPLAPGRYAARLVAAGEPPVDGAEAELLVTDMSVEKSQVRQDRRRLEQLAGRAAGTYRDAAVPGAADSLGYELLQRDWRGIADRQRQRLDLWSGWPFIAVVTVLLGVEWFLRRRHGLL